MKIALQKNWVRESGNSRQEASCPKAMSRVTRKYPKLLTREAVVSLVRLAEGAVPLEKIRAHADSQ